MNEEILLKSENFSLSLNFQVFASDISYPSNTILSVSVSSDGFSATTTMDIDIKDIPVFCNDLKNIYDLLKGEAKIQEPYGKQYILFSGHKLGNINVCGVLHSNGAGGFWQELKFENAIDQTYLPRFFKDLATLSQQFIK